MLEKTATTVKGRGEGSPSITEQVKAGLKEVLRLVAAVCIALIMGVVFGILWMISQIKPRGVFEGLKSLVRGYFKNKTNILLTVMFLCLASLIALTTFHYTETPEFCLSCHLMKPYYISHQTSPHEEVHSCLECHYEPGIIGKIKGKIGGGISLVRYITGMYSLPLESHISYDVCLRCHEPNKTIEYRGIRLQHWHEVGEGERKCGFCHSDEHRIVPHADCNKCHEGIIHGERKDVEMETCISCHSESGISNRCGVCHENY